MPRRLHLQILLLADLGLLLALPSELRLVALLPCCWHAVLLFRQTLRDQSTAKLITFLTALLPPYLVIAAAPTTGPAIVATTLLGGIATVLSWLLLTTRPKSIVSAVFILIALAVSLWLAPVPEIICDRLVMAFHAWGERPPAGTTGDGTWDGDRGARLSLEPLPFKGGDRPEAFVRAVSPKAAPLQVPTYLTEHTFGALNGNVWSPLPGQTLKMDPLDGAVDGWTPLLETLPAVNYRQLSCEVFDLLPNRMAILTVTGANSIALPGLLAKRSGFDFVRRPPGPVSYRQRARSVQLDDIPPESVWPALAHPEFTAAPESQPLIEAVAAIRRQIAFADDSSPWVRLDQAINHYARNYRYDRDNSRLSATNPLVDFMTGERSGNCTFFASALALTLRDAGFPARVAVGYTTNTYDQSGTALVVRGTDAHAWTEVRLLGHGWIVVDALSRHPFYNPQTTANAAAVALTPADFLRLSQTAEDISEVVPLAVAEEVELPTTTATPQLSSRWLTIAGLLLGGLLLGALLRRSKQATTSAADAAAVDPAAPFLARALRYLAETGSPKRSAETLQEYLQRLADHGPHHSDLLAYYYGVRYSGQPTDRRREGAILKRLRQTPPQPSPPATRSHG